MATAAGCPELESRTTHRSLFFSAMLVRRGPRGSKGSARNRAAAQTPSATNTTPSEQWRQRERVVDGPYTHTHTHTHCTYTHTHTHTYAHTHSEDTHPGPGQRRRTAAAAGPRRRRRRLAELASAGGPPSAGSPQPPCPCPRPTETGPSPPSAVMGGKDGSTILPPSLCPRSNLNGLAWEVARSQRGCDRT